MYNFLAGAFLICALSLPLNAHQIYFLPKQNKQAKDALIQGIANAKTAIDLALYAFTDKDLTKALRLASKRGIVIHLVLDASQNAGNAQSAMNDLARLYRVKVCLLSGQKSKAYNRYTQTHLGLMHLKMMIVDKTLMFSGSANWSANSFKNSWEMLSVDDDPKILESANAFYGELLSKCPGFL
ncbi:Nuclease NucT [Helicobacter ailurogastricus]|uniref:phospholipase D-like domain-containing protein n=1 Tax=Helicobacter ailurogastricus TaxID=1578720 RepID=UPI00244D9514|nr:phospholipase D-like domain-containing protein [Helicobacter ailurogastricus]GMB90584.1 Nuclease NucT [Helicobacter ailurogastricus]